MCRNLRRAMAERPEDFSEWPDMIAHVIEVIEPFETVLARAKKGAARCSRRSLASSAASGRRNPDARAAPCRHPRRGRARLLRAVAAHRPLNLPTSDSLRPDLKGWTGTGKVAFGSNVLAAATPTDGGQCTSADQKQEPCGGKRNGRWDRQFLVFVSDREFQAHIGRLTD